MKNQLFFITVALVLWQVTTFAQPGSLDLSFNPADVGLGYGDGANGTISASAIQSDGKIIIGGAFTAYNGTTLNRIARVNTDGSLDTTFNAGTGANGPVFTTAIQSDGKIIIGGGFTTYNGTAINRIARLNTDGSLDTSFNVGTGADAYVLTTAIQSDGKIIIGGWLTTYDSDTVNYIARLNTDGSLDTSFNPGTGADNSVRSISVQSDGKIIIGGWLTTYNSDTVNYIARLNTDGSLDTSFNTGTGANSSVAISAIQSDGKIIIGGIFTSYNGTAINRIARLNTDGSLDTSFNVGYGANAPVYAIKIQSNNKIIIAGDFTYYSLTSKKGVARINADGSVDTSFDPGTGADNYVRALSIQSDGKIIIGGEFISYNGAVRTRIARIHTSGLLDSSFNTEGTGANNMIYATAIQSDGKIIIGGRFTSFNGTVARGIARLNTDGSIDPSFNSGIGADGTVYTISVQNDGKIIIGGNFTSYNNIQVDVGLVRLNTDGTLDTSFDPEYGLWGDVYTTSIQNNGKIIIGGEFYIYVNGIQINDIVRLNADGSLDISFNPGTGSGWYIWTTSIQNDGKIVIGGLFTSFNGTSVLCIARLNTNGSLDTSFNSGTGANGTVLTTSVQSDGKIIIGGDFPKYNGDTVNYIARLNTDGSLDTTFNTGTGADAYVTTTLIQEDEKIVIGGSFTTFNGNTLNRIARLNTDGSLDASFNTGTGASDQVRTATMQCGGKIIIGGMFTAYDGTGRNRIARLHNDCFSCLYPATTATVCNEDSIFLGGQYQFNAGTYYDTLQSIYGCDSIIETQLTVIPVDTSLIINDISLTANASNATFQWIDCDNANLPLAGETYQSYTATANGSYAVIVTQNGCTDTSACYTLSNVGIGYNDFGSSLLVYPNPVSKLLTIELNGSGGKTLIKISDIIGTQVLERKFSENSTSFSMEHLTDGVYILSIQNRDEQAVFKIIKSHNR